MNDKGSLNLEQVILVLFGLLAIPFLLFGLINLWIWLWNIVGNAPIWFSLPFRVLMISYLGAFIPIRLLHAFRRLFQQNRIEQYYKFKKEHIIQLSNWVIEE